MQLWYKEAKEGVGGTLLGEVCASLQFQREAVTHLGVAGGVWGVLSTTQSHLFIQLITCSPVQCVNEPSKSILFYAKYHFVFIVLELQLLTGKKKKRIQLACSHYRSPATLFACLKGYPILCFIKYSSHNEMAFWEHPASVMASVILHVSCWNRMLGDKRQHRETTLNSDRNISSFYG